MSVMWLPGAALQVLGRNANMPIGRMYVNKHVFSPKWGSFRSKEFQKNMPIGRTYVNKHVFSPKWGSFRSKEFQKQRRPKVVALSTNAQGSFGEYNDDEIISYPTFPVDNSDFNFGEKIMVTIFNKQKAPLEETNLKVLIELLGAGFGEDRAGVDLVAVLDIGFSMGSWGNAAKEDRIAIIRKAMQFVITKLSPIDRLSIVLFNSFTYRLFPLRQITEKSQTEIIDKLDWYTPTILGSDIVAGLETGLKVIKDRRYTTGRVPAIMLMSGGDKNVNQFPDMMNVPVHTFGVGQGYHAQVLKAIAEHSKGGTFSDVQKNDLSTAFSVCLAGLLTVVVQDLTLTVTRGGEDKELSTIDKVYAGNYPQTVVPGSVTISFGNLYDKELRKILVDLRLPANPLPEEIHEVGANILGITCTYTYSVAGETTLRTFESAPTKINISRVKKSVETERKEVKNEDIRHQTVGKMLEARLMADENKLEEAQAKLLEAHTLLQDDDRNAMMKELLTEVNQLKKLMGSKDVYEMQGRPYTLSLEASHGGQRSAARGNDVKTGSLYSTPHMNTFLEQAKAFVEDPTKPVPTVDEDVKK